MSAKFAVDKHQKIYVSLKKRSDYLREPKIARKRTDLQSVRFTLRKLYYM